MDAVQLDMFAPVEEEPLYVICERKAEAICNELWAKYRGNVREYVAECVDRFVKAGIYWYDLREDDRVDYEDVIGECFCCGKPITAREICNVDAIEYSWKRKDGRHINAYVHYSGECIQKKVMNSDEFHKVYLRLTGYTDEEYIQNLKKEQPSVFQMRVQLGYYDEEGHRLQPEGFATDKKSKRRKVA